jgi:hypothetical protein
MKHSLTVLSSVFPLSFHVAASLAPHHLVVELISLVSNLALQVQPEAMADRHQASATAAIARLHGLHHQHAVARDLLHEAMGAVGLTTTPGADLIPGAEVPFGGEVEVGAEAILVEVAGPHRRAGVAATQEEKVHLHE